MPSHVVSCSKNPQGPRSATRDNSMHHGAGSAMVSIQCKRFMNSVFGANVKVLETRLPLAVRGIDPEHDTRIIGNRCPRWAMRVR